MVVVQIVLQIVNVALTLLLVLLWGRFVLELMQSLMREWRPRGAILVAAEVVYTVTDPPVKFVRRIFPPVRLGQAAIDFSIAIVMIAVVVLTAIVGAFLTGA